MRRGGDEATHQWPLGAVACCSRFLLTCALLVTSSHSEGLGLEAAGVDYDSAIGVKVNEFYQTANPDIYASGDVVSPYKFTHTADWSAR